jgi:hypothetical protein
MKKTSKTKPEIMKRGSKKLKPGDKVLLTQLPPGLLSGLPREDQRAISEIVGKPILLVEFDDDGRAELEFVDRNEVFHYIYVDPKFISPV